MDFTKSVEIAPNIYWVGMQLKDDPFQCLPYLIKNGDESILIDPGSMLEFDEVIKKIQQVVELKSIKYIVLHHQDPDLCAAVPHIEKLIDRDDLQIVTHSRMTVLIKHYVLTSSYYEIDKHNLKLTTSNGVTLKFLTTPYCHSPGAFVSYEANSKVLFSGDIFGGLEESWSFYADENYFLEAKAFHAAYMPSRDIFNYALRKIEELDINLIAPQHGSLIEKKYINNLIEDMKNLECGLYIENKYNAELIGTIHKLEKQERELEEYKNHLEEKVKEKTHSLKETNAVLELEKTKLSKFNHYLSDLNSVDVSYLANCAIEHILDFSQAQVGVFYIKNEDDSLKVLAKYSVDDKILESKFLDSSKGGIVAKAYKEREWIYVDGLSEATSPTINLGFCQTKLKSIVAIPLCFQEKRIGVILLGSVKSSSYDEDYLRAYISTLVQSLNNAITFVYTQKQSLELQNINMQLEESNRLKSEFLANVSHELRTPLNSIIGFSNILQRNKKENLLPKQLEQLEKIHRNGLGLLDLINNILDLSKIESGKIEIELREVDILQVVSSTLELLLVQATNNAKEILFKNSLGVNSYSFITDEQKIQQVIVNLISNALKFIPNSIGKIEVEIFKENSFLKIAIKDNGIGIEKDKFEKIFEAFRQSDGSMTREYGGTGLGLTISKNILELLHGHIELESEVNIGSTFTICLPEEQLSNSVSEYDFLDDFKEHIKIEKDISSVLIIDDTKDVIDLLKVYLNAENYTVYSASNGEEGLQKAKELKPSLITLDIMMPGLDGWEVLKKLKGCKDTANIPVIIITNVENRAKSYALGAIDSLSKPIAKDDLKSLINKYFGNTRVLNALIIDDEKDIRDLIDEYIYEETENIKQACDGREALSIIEDGFIPNIIYLDLMMPNLSGFEFLQIIRTTPKLYNTHIIVVTAKDLTNDDIKFLNYNRVSIVRKGGYIEDVLKHLTKEAKEELS